MNYYDHINNIIAEKFAKTNSSLDAVIAAEKSIREYLGSQYMYEQLESYTHNAIALAAKLYDQEHLVMVRVA